jgi:hypothetical protein
LTDTEFCATEINLRKFVQYCRADDESTKYNCLVSELLVDVFLDGNTDTVETMHQNSAR